MHESRNTRRAERTLLCCAVAVAATVFASPPAHAFVTSCHQAITQDGLATAGWPLASSPPPLSDDQRLLIGELPNDVPPGVADLWTLSALVGNYYVDGGSYDLKDVVALAERTAMPDEQRKHCLRAPGDDGAAGDASALAACKAFILSQLSTALGEGDAPDLGGVESVRVHLVFRGDADLPLPRYAFHLGQATHALQDSFTHAFRSPDLRRVRGVLNWVDWIRDPSYDPTRDGSQHIQALDHCGASDQGGLERRQAARDATAQLAAAVADDAGGRAGRLARAAVVIDDWFGLDESCGPANHWCEAPERALAGASGCAIAPRRASAPAMIASLAVLAGAIGLSARRRRRAGPVALAVLLCAGAAERRASAEDASRGEHKGQLLSKAGPEEQKKLVARPFGVVVSGGFSIDNAGYDVGLGVRYDLGRRFTVGLGVEYSPWLSLETSRGTRGTTNAFGVGVFRLDVRDYLELRLTAEAGVSVLMFDTWAARAGAVGPFFALSPLGVGIRMTDHLRLLVDPAELVVAIPQMRGIPLAYREHRFAIALQVNF
jgi:hypothetical protein